MKHEHFLLIILLSIGIFAFLIQFLNPWQGYGMMGYYNPGFGAMYIFMTLFWILAFVALVLFILWLIKQLNKGEKRNKYEKN